MDLFSLSRYFYVRTHVTFTCLNKIDAMYEVRVNVKVKRSFKSFKLTLDCLYIASIAFTRVKFTDGPQLTL